jgi:hypothetical protein
MGHSPFTAKGDALDLRALRLHAGCIKAREEYALKRYLGRVALCGRDPVLLCETRGAALPAIDEDGQQYIPDAHADDDK